MILTAVFGGFIGNHPFFLKILKNSNQPFLVIPFCIFQIYYNDMDYFCNEGNKPHFSFQYSELTRIYILVNFLAAFCLYSNIS